MRAGAVRNGLLYGALCFAAGFVLGTLRELVLIPAFGPALGRQIEFPIVTLAAVAIAWWLVQRTGEARTIGFWLGVGLLGVATLLVFESSLALLVLGMPLEIYLAGFDVRQGALFPVGLAVMLVAPGVLAMVRRSSASK